MSIVDIGGGYGLFADEIKKKFQEYLLLNPHHIWQKFAETKGIML